MPTDERSNKEIILERLRKLRAEGTTKPPIKEHLDKLKQEADITAHLADTKVTKSDGLYSGPDS